MKQLQIKLINKILNEMINQNIVIKDDCIYNIYKESLKSDSITELEQILTDLENKEFIVF